MTFSDFGYLHLVWLVPVIVAFWLFCLYRRRLMSRHLADSELIVSIVTGRPRPNAWIALLFIFFMIFCVIALMGPRWGYHYERVRYKGADIVIALDVSNSMRATDVKPSRLQRAKMEIRHLLQTLQGDRVGLVAFAGAAVPLCPLTVDYDAFQEFLKDADPEMITLQGTNLYAALNTALDMIERSGEGQGAIILITDGEDHSGRFKEAVKRAEDSKVVLYTVAVGTSEGAPIPLPEGGFLKDSQGNIVVTHVNEEALREAALLTGGAFVQASGGDMQLAYLYKEHLKNLERTRIEEKRRKIWEERFQYPLALALLCLALFVFAEEKWM